VLNEKVVKPSNSENKLSPHDIDAALYEESDEIIACSQWSHLDKTFHIIQNKFVTEVNSSEPLTAIHSRRDFRLRSMIFRPIGYCLMHIIDRFAVIVNTGALATKTK
jgi:hypothetical protein